MVSLAKDAISKPNTVDVDAWADAVADPFAHVGATTAEFVYFYFPKNVSNYCLEEEILNSEVDGLYTGIVSKLHYWSGVDPEKNVLLQLDSKGEVKSKFSYKDLYRHSGIVASHLLREGLKAKDRVMIIYPVHSVLEYLTAFHHDSLHNSMLYCQVQYKYMKSIGINEKILLWVSSL
jgi:hypothetical protein